VLGTQETSCIIIAGLLERNSFDLLLPKFDKPWVIHLRETCCCSTNLCTWRPNTVYKDISVRRHHLPPLENCYLDVPLADVAKKKPLGRIYYVLIMVNNNLVPVDFLVLDIECNASCPIILGRPFLRTVSAIIDMKESTIRYQFPLKKGMEHFLRKRTKLPFDSIIRTNYELDTSSLENT
jgi:hypothetical protein